jgi:hypothetical protein
MVQEWQCRPSPKAYRTGILKRPKVLKSQREYIQMKKKGRIIFRVLFSSWPAPMTTSACYVVAMPTQDRSTWSLAKAMDRVARKSSLHWCRPGTRLAAHTCLPHMRHPLVSPARNAQRRHGAGPGRVRRACQGGAASGSLDRSGGVPTPPRAAAHARARGCARRLAWQRHRRAEKDDKRECIDPSIHDPSGPCRSRAPPTSPFPLLLLSDRRQKPGHH